MQLERPTTSASLLGSLYQQQQTQGNKTVDEPKVHCRVFHFSSNCVLMAYSKILEV